MIILIVVVFAITALIGIPIAFCMGLVSLASLLAEGRIFFLKLIAQKMITGIDKFPLMAIPLFILAGKQVLLLLIPLFLGQYLCQR